MNIHLSNTELCAMGYVTIQKKGLLTLYTPTPFFNHGTRRPTIVPRRGEAPPPPVPVEREAIRTPQGASKPMGKLLPFKSTYSFIDENKE